MKTDEGPGSPGSWQGGKDDSVPLAHPLAHPEVPPVARALARLIASGLASGYAPVAPGTAGSAVALLLGAGLLAVSPWLLLAAAVVTSIGGIWAIRAARVTGDPGWVVIDEFAGQFIALLGLAQLSLAGAAAAFVLFRLLDVTKPGPIGWADRRNGAVAIMGDDLIAGVMAAALLWMVHWCWPGLLG